MKVWLISIPENKEFDDISLDLNCFKQVIKGDTIIILNNLEKSLSLCEIPGAILIDKLTNNFFSIYNDLNIKEKISLIKTLHLFSENDKIEIHDLTKMYNKERINILMSTVPLNSNIYEVLRDLFTEDECIAYKNGDTWGFLYYTKDKDNNESFKFEAISNFDIDGKKLTPTDENYRDFTYFMLTEALPPAYKIGRASNPEKRLRQVNGANPRNVKMLTILPDGRMEKMFHDQFSVWLCKRKVEWFEMHQDITELIKRTQQRTKRIIKLYKKYKAAK